MRSAPSIAPCAPPAVRNRTALAPARVPPARPGHALVALAGREPPPLLSRPSRLPPSPGDPPVTPLRTPYLMFIGDAHDQLAAKVADGVVFWRRDWCAGQFRLPGCKADLKLPDLSIKEAAAAGVGT